MKSSKSVKGVEHGNTFLAISSPARSTLTTASFLSGKQRFVRTEKMDWLSLHSLLPQRQCLFFHKKKRKYLSEINLRNLVKILSPPLATEKSTTSANRAPWI
eukprot:Lithocolla_globosa_v1_NODE_5967_length_1156_cov_4.128974.p2 type:complete len:102 gc:universal NODE_5967_length_1156_cov_4.128974:351-46(-)